MTMFPKVKKDSTRRECYSVDFNWTDEHLTHDQLRPLIYTYDTLAAEALDRLDDVQSLALRNRDIKKMPNPHGDARADLDEKEGKEKCPMMGGDLFQLLKERAPRDEVLNRLWTQVNTVPDWVDWAQIKRGQDIFYRYVGPSIVALTFHSLLGGMGSRRIVETLTRTGGFGVKVARRRLLETFQHVLDVTRDLDSIKPGGKGWETSIRVRFLHASVRRRIMRLAKERPDYYDVQDLGVPVNDLDAITTIIGFSVTLVWIGFPRQGIYMTEQEVYDYVALWRWIAHIMGTPTGPFETPQTAKMWMESILLTEIEPTKTSQILANNIIAGLHSQPPVNASKDFLRAEAWWLNGEELASALNVPKPPFYYFILVAGQCIFFTAMTYFRRLVPWFDMWSVNRMRKIVHATVMEQVGGEEAGFRFSYIPDLGKITLGEEEGTMEKGGVARFVRTWVWWRGENPERRNLVAFLVAGALVGYVSWWAVTALASTEWFASSGSALNFLKV